MNVMLLTAGEGTRLRPFTLQKPKPAIPFLGTPLACYSLSLLDRIPIHNLAFNTFHLPLQVESLFRSLRPQWKNLCVSEESAGLLGSGGGIHKARPFLEGHGNFIVMNGDELILPHSLGLMSEMIRFHEWHDGLATLLTMPHPEVGTTFGGVWLEGKDRVKCFSKTRPADASLRGLHFLGVMIFSDRIFKYFKPQVQDENVLYETLTSAMTAGESVYSYECQAEWFETGNPKSFLAATKTCLEALCLPPMNKPYWVEHLEQTFRLYGKADLFIENEDPVLRDQLQNFYLNFYP